MRFLLMEFHQESNSFCPRISVEEDFRREIWWEGDQIALRRGSSTITGGMMQALEESGTELVPGFGLSAQSGGPVEHAVVQLFEEKLRAAVAACGKVDGCLLSLHGALQSTACEDVEGEIVSLARQLLGKDAVIACAFDLHGAITRRIVEQSDVITGYWTYPHVDQFETGYRAAMLAVRAAKGERLHMAAAFLPMLQPASGYSTETLPLRPVMEGLKERLARGEIADFSAFQMQPWLDIADAASTVIVMGEDEAVCRRVAAQTAQELWAIRHDMTPSIDTVDDAIAAALCHEDGRPVVIADYADSPGAGAAGDNFDIAAEIMEKAPQLRVAAAINDTALVQQAFDAGVGATLETTVGGTRAPGCSRAYPVRAQVAQLSDGVFVDEGPMCRGLTEYGGRTATLRIGNVTLVASESLVSAGDLQALRHFGAEPTLSDVVAVKACTSFRAAYEPIASAIFTVDTLCAASARLAEMPFRRVPRWFYPFTDDPHPAALDEIFSK
ncbi:MAG: M81 family metallopeptidase [Oscillospiraceae bacterium]|nr:M81 family metallopeptidase [Oscillospiraceae bacterium]